MRTLGCVSVAARAGERPGLLSARPGPRAWEQEPAIPAAWPRGGGGREMHPRGRAWAGPTPAVFPSACGPRQPVGDGKAETAGSPRRQPQVDTCRGRRRVVTPASPWPLSRPGWAGFPRAVGPPVRVASQLRAARISGPIRPPLLSSPQLWATSARHGPGACFPVTPARVGALLAVGASVEPRWW